MVTKSKLQEQSIAPHKLSEVTNTNYQEVQQTGALPSTQNPPKVAPRITPKRALTPKQGKPMLKKVISLPKLQAPLVNPNTGK